jgi:DNA repair protein REV1
MAHADDLQAVSVDEALIDVTNAVKSTSPTDPHLSAKEYAETIRNLVRQETGCEGLSIILNPLWIPF